MKKTLVVLALLAALVALPPLLRDVERGPLDAAARAAAPGRYAALAHGPVHYEWRGPAEGETVVLVPGFSVPSYVFEPLDAQLADAGFRVLRYDLYGRGWSARPDVVYDRDLYVAQLRELLDALQVPRAHVVGLSMGGAIAGRFAAQQPHRVQRLVLIAPLTRARDITPLHWPLVGEWATRAWLLPKLAASQTSDFVHPERHPDWAARFLPQMRHDGFGRAILSTLRHVTTRDSLPDFAAVEQPDVLLVWGRLDGVVPFSHNDAVREAIPQARLAAIDDAGHLPHVEHPEIVGPIVVGFLRGTERLAPR